MKYAITHNNKVLFYSNSWNYILFKNRILFETGINLIVPVKESVPVLLENNIKILPITVEKEIYEERVQVLSGPFWDIQEDKVIANFFATNKDIQVVKRELKEKVAEIRYYREIGGFQTEIQGFNVTIDTDRTSRDIFFLSYLSMQDADTILWKFPETWLTLTKQELGSIVSEGKYHIQSQFIWESQKSLEIDTCNTLEELSNLNLKE